MRTVFQLQGAVDAERLNARARRARGASCAAGSTRDGVADDDIEVIRALDCRYVGQGYELRVHARGAVRRAALEQFHGLHEREYGSAYRRPDRDRQRPRDGDRQAPGARARCRSPSGSHDEALLGESESHFRVDGELQRADDAVLRPRPAAARRVDRRRRRRLPPRHDDRRAARLDARGPIASGNLILAKGGSAMSAVRTTSRPDHRGRDRRRARLDRGRDGPQARPHGVLLDHPRVRGLRLRDLRRPGAPAVRVVAVDAAPVRPDPRLHRRHQPPLRRARRSTGSRATWSSTTTRTTAPRTSRTSASSCRSSTTASSSASRRRPPTTSTSAR